MIKACFETSPNFHDASRHIRTQTRYLEQLLQSVTDDENGERLSPRDG
jgi:hypothetical protein